MNANQSAWSEALPWIAMWGVIGIFTGVRALIRRHRRTMNTAPGGQGSADPSPGAGTTTDPGAASTPTPGPAIPAHCRQRGHAMRRTSDTTWACANQDCPVTATVETKHVHVDAELHRRLVAPTSAEEYLAARAEFGDLIANTPSEREILDAACEDFRSELDGVEAYANGEAAS